MVERLQPHGGNELLAGLSNARNAWPHAHAAGSSRHGSQAAKWPERGGSRAYSAAEVSRVGWELIERCDGGVP